jgi:hypothetical protein
VAAELFCTFTYDETVKQYLVLELRPVTEYVLPVEEYEADEGDAWLMVYEAIPVSPSVQERLMADAEDTVAFSDDGTVVLAVVTVVVAEYGPYADPYCRRTL